MNDQPVYQLFQTLRSALAHDPELHATLLEIRRRYDELNYTKDGVLAEVQLAVSSEDWPVVIGLLDRLADIDTSGAAAALRSIIGDLNEDGIYDRIPEALRQYADIYQPGDDQKYYSKQCYCGFKFQKTKHICPICNRMRRIVRVSSKQDLVDAAAIVHIDSAILKLNESVDNEDLTQVLHWAGTVGDLGGKQTQLASQARWYNDAVQSAIGQNRFEDIKMFTKDFRASVEHDRLRKICGGKNPACDACGGSISASHWFCPNCKAVRRLCQHSGLALEENGRCKSHNSNPVSQQSKFEFTTPYLQDVYVHFKNTTDLLDVRDHVAVIDVRIAQLLRESSGFSYDAVERELTGLHRKLRNTVNGLEKAFNKGDSDGIVAMRSLLLDIVMDWAESMEKAKLEDHRWGEIYQAMEQRRKYTDTHQKIEVGGDNFLPISYVMSSMVMLTEMAINRLAAVIPDEMVIRSVRKQLAGDLRAITKGEIEVGEVIDAS